MCHIKSCFNLTLSWCLSFFILLFASGLLKLLPYRLAMSCEPCKLFLVRGLRIILFHWQKLAVFMLLVSMILDSLACRLIKVTQLYEILALLFICWFFLADRICLVDTIKAYFQLPCIFFLKKITEWLFSFFSSFLFFEDNFITPISCVV